MPASEQKPTDEEGFHGDEIYEEEVYEEPVNEPEGRGGTPLSTWVAVFGSSAVFHALLLILLGLIVISEPQEDQEEVTLEVPEEEEEEKQPITKREIKKEIEKETEQTNPQVETTENMEEVDSEMTADTGQSLKFDSDTQNNQEVERSIALSGGGEGGTYGERGGAGLSGDRGGGGTSQRAVEAALKWLAKHQNEEGYWDLDNYDEQCPEGNRCKVLVDHDRPMDVGTTGLALLAFLGAGYTHQSDENLGGIDVGNVVHRTLRWLKEQQKQNGAFSEVDPQINARQEPMYNHAIAAIAYAEAYGMTGAPRLKKIAQKGIDYLENAQNKNDGELLAWRYEANSGDNDTSVTGWCAMALKSAEIAGLETSEEALQGALRWVEQNTNQRGLTGYASKMNSRGEALDHRSMTPVGMLIRMFANDDLYKKQLKALKKGADFVVSNLPKWHEGTEIGSDKMDYYYWYYGSLALFMFAGPDTRFEQLGYWQKWNQPMQKAVLSGQQTARDGHETGSWDAVSRWSRIGGRVYTTAINALTLEVYYRYDNALFQ